MNNAPSNVQLKAKGLKAMNEKNVKKETGKTLSEYIRSKRIEFASQLLLDTNLQVQTIAFHCGIMDVQYFSKIFKKETGLTPSEYRISHRTAGQV